MSEDRWGAWVTAMRAGRYQDAWAISDAVLAERDSTTRDDPRVDYHQRWVWDGRRVDGRDALVRCYHGLGDTLQFARFLPEAARRAASLTAETQAPLVPLIRSIVPDAEVRPFDPERPLPPAELDLEITELSHALRMPPEEAPPPYLGVEPMPLPRATIGLCPGAGAWDPDRWVPQRWFEPMAERHPCAWLRPEPTDLKVINPAGCPSDMMAAAAWVAGCALVITVDTMIAHLAGALGRPCWVLLKAEPDWRWAADRRDSAWYPATRLYVQRQAGDWDGVMAAVQYDLVNSAGRRAGIW